MARPSQGIPRKQDRICSSQSGFACKLQKIHTYVCEDEVFLQNAMHPLISLGTWHLCSQTPNNKIEERAPRYQYQSSGFDSSTPATGTWGESSWAFLVKPRAAWKKAATSSFFTDFRASVDSRMRSNLELEGGSGGGCSTRRSGSGGGDGGEPETVVVCNQTAAHRKNTRHDCSTCSTRPQH